MMPRPWLEPFGPRRFPFPMPPPDFRPDVYAGPEEFMQVGARGFLVTTTTLGKEELAIDNAIELLRQASIKLYGGFKLSEKKRSKVRKLGHDLGSVRMDFMDPAELNILSPPEGEEEEDEDEEPAKEEGKKDGESKKENDAKKEDEGPKSKADEQDEGPKSKADEQDEESKMDEAEEEKEKDKEEETEQEEKNKEEVKSEEEQKEEKQGEGSEKEDKKEGEEKKSTDKEGDNKENKSASPKKEPVLRMRSQYKFKAFRTEIRHVMFIKSDVPDPMRVAEEAMEIILLRKMLPSDAICQLFPVLGVCNFEHSQLEVMTRRVLASIFDETQEPKSFSVILVDKLSEPGSELLFEIVRNAIWSVSPAAWLSSPITEPDAVIRVELVGRKLVLCCLSHFMRYRHYTPGLLLELGAGEAEEDDGTWTSAELRKQQEMWRQERERVREEARQREEERRKEREKRRAEAEARRKEEEKERELQREREREERKRSREESEKDEKKKEEKEEEQEEERKEEEEIEADVSRDEDTDEQTPAEKEEEEGNERRESTESKDSPPKKKQRVESSEMEEEGEKEEAVEESEEVEDEETEGKKTTPKRKTRAKRGRRKASK